MIPIPLSYRLAAAGVAAAALAWWSYDAGRDSRAEEIATMAGAAASQNARYRTLEKEASHAMQTILARNRVGLDAVRAEFQRLRDETAGSRGVPTVPAVDGSLEECRVRLGRIAAEIDGVRRQAEESGRGAEAGAECAVTLGTCQAELRVCAGLR